MSFNLAEWFKNPLIFFPVIFVDNRDFLVNKNHWQAAKLLNQMAKDMPGGNQQKHMHLRLGEHIEFEKEIDVSKNIGFSPKSSILIGFSIINHPFWGTPIFGNTQIN